MCAVIVASLAGAIMLVHAAAPVNTAETLTCSTWQGVRTCSSPDGYLSRESQWQGLVTGDTNQENRWTTSRWRDIETTTITPRSER